MLSELRLRLSTCLPVRSQRGFTLVETLVAMLTGVVVTGALFAIMEFSMKHDTRITNIAAASQLGRTAMTHVVDELHSACLASGFSPVQKGSTETKLIFVDGYSELAEIPNVGTSTTGARKDEITWGGSFTGPKRTEETAGALTDNTALATGGEASTEYTFGTPSGVRIGENIVRGEESSGALEPPFRYFEYAEHSTTGSGEVSTLQEIKLGNGAALTKEQAENVAAVEVTFRAPPPTNGSKSAAELGRESSDQSSMVTFAFAAPNSESTIKAGPCE
jgi:type II secretory pathway pseudopilin PulG